MGLNSMEIKLKKHQQKLVDENKKKNLLAWECGTGKSFGLLGLIQKNQVNPLLLTIKSDYDKWVGLIESHNLEADVMTKEQFRKATTKQIIKKVFDEKTMKKVEIKKTVPAPERLKRYNAVIIDEVHFFSLSTSMMNKSILKYLKLYKPEYLWIASATSCDDNPWKLFGIGNILGHDWNYKRFQHHFFHMKRFPVKRKHINGLPIEKEVAKYIRFLGDVVKMDDCVDMPPRVLMKEYFEMTADQKKYYKLIGEDKELLVITRNGKWQQICGGTLHLTERDPETEKIIKDERLLFKCDKLNRLIELCEEHKKIFIVCKYSPEVEYIKETLQKKFKDKKIFKFTGKTSSSRKKYADETDKLDECVVIANAACSEAYETNTIPIMIFYSYSFKLIHYIQIRDRIRRINNIGIRTYISLIIKNSIDEAVYESIQNKKSFDDAIYKKNE